MGLSRAEAPDGPQLDRAFEGLLGPPNQQVGIKKLLCTLNIVRIIEYGSAVDDSNLLLLGGHGRWIDVKIYVKFIHILMPFFSLESFFVVGIRMVVEEVYKTLPQLT